MMKIIGNYVWNKFRNILEFFDYFWAIFSFSLKTHDFSEIFFENSKKALFDLWDLLWWVFHMILALNHWFRQKNEGSKKSVPKNFKTAVTLVLKVNILENFKHLCKSDSTIIVFVHWEKSIFQFNPFLGTHFWPGMCAWPGSHSLYWFWLLFCYFFIWNVIKMIRFEFLRL